MFTRKFATLQDMLSKHAQTFIKNIDLLGLIIQKIEDAEKYGIENNFTEHDINLFVYKGSVRNDIDFLLKFQELSFKGLDLPVVEDFYNDISLRIKDVSENNPYPLSELKANIKHLQFKIDQGLSNRWIYFIDKNDIENQYEVSKLEGSLLDANEPLFGGIIYDLEEAIQCLSFDRTTASVFHCGRIFEFGLREMLKVLKNFESDTSLPIYHLSNVATWDKIRAEINKYFDNPPYKTQPNKFQNENDFREILIHLNSIRIVWRNPTMHPEVKFTKEEAVRIVKTTKDFLLDLSKLDTFTA